MRKSFTAKSSSTTVSTDFLLTHLPVSSVFSLQTFRDAANWIVTWIRDNSHNPTEFTQDLPALIDLARDYRKELLQNPEKAKGSSNLIMGMCITDFGHFSHLV